MSDETISNEGSSNHVPEEETPTSRIKQEHEELYGKLLEVDAALADAESVPNAFYVLGTAGLCFAVAIGLYRYVPVLADVDLNRFWTYVFIFISCCCLWYWHSSWLKRRAYARHREGLLNSIHSARIERYRLLSRLEGDFAVNHAFEMLKRDRWE